MGQNCGAQIVESVNVQVIPPPTVQLTVLSFAKEMTSPTMLMILQLLRQIIVDLCGQRWETEHLMEETPQVH